FKRTVTLPGHADWVRTIAVATFTDTENNAALIGAGFNDGDLIVATGSQDRYIRLWKVNDLGLVSDARGKPKDTDGGFDNALEMLHALAGEDRGDDGRQLSTKAHVIEASGRNYMIMFDALLIGHDDWVHSVAWEHARIDKSVVVWRPDAINSIWNADVRLGEAGGSAFGFYGAHFSPSGCGVVAMGYHGAVQMWSTDQPGGTTWTPEIGLTGHFKAAECVEWRADGAFFVSASLDQTCRVWAPWKRRRGPGGAVGDDCETWHEIARPQIHGYDVHCVAFVGPHRLVSGADEKVLRVFDAPKLFLKNLENIAGIHHDPDVL
ncbi:Elongator subunit elp2, partial [Cladochytrium tenue]